MNSEVYLSEPKKIILKTVPELIIELGAPRSFLLSCPLHIIREKFNLVRRGVNHQEPL